jgi:hypothetical protein
MCGGHGSAAPSISEVGNSSSRSSIQSTRTFIGASARAIARPTWPAP